MASCYALRLATAIASLTALNADASAQRGMSPSQLAPAFNAVLWSAFYEADGRNPLLYTETLGAPGARMTSSLRPGLPASVEDTATVSWPRVLGATALGALAGHTVSWQLFGCSFDDDPSCSGYGDLLTVPIILTPVVSVGGAAMLAGADSWRSVGGTTLGTLGSVVMYMLGFAGDLPQPAIVGLAGLTHAVITTLVAIR